MQVEDVHPASVSTKPDKAAASARDWNKNLLSMLAKAVARYPAGTGHRWEAVSEHMNTSLKPSEPFTKDECMKVAHSAGKP